MTPTLIPHLPSPCNTNAPEPEKITFIDALTYGHRFLSIISTFETC
ncbi:hypothetical protein Gorai_006433 [Gossypium raimondii]|uniref:Uncharacterized protein n=1 Tax=Gossypium raimondii TaxID=29730 RepID=A0A7J8QFH7_GOSRA|nr:hypothetical protein [Gossypium raimondii]